MFPHLLEVLDAEFDDHDFVYAAVRRHALRSPNDLFARLTGRLIKVAEIFRGRWIGFVQHGTKERNNIWVLLVRRFVSFKAFNHFCVLFCNFHLRLSLFLSRSAVHKRGHSWPLFHIFCFFNTSSWKDIKFACFLIRATNCFNKRFLSLKILNILTSYVLKLDFDKTILRALCVSASKLQCTKLTWNVSKTNLRSVNETLQLSLWSPAHAQPRFGFNVGGRFSNFPVIVSVRLLGFSRVEVEYSRTFCVFNGLCDLRRPPRLSFKAADVDLDAGWVEERIVSHLEIRMIHLGADSRLLVVYTVTDKLKNHMRKSYNKWPIL